MAKKPLRGNAFLFFVTWVVFAIVSVCLVYGYYQLYKRDALKEVRHVKAVEKCTRNGGELVQLGERYRCLDRMLFILEGE